VVDGKRALSIWKELGNEGVIRHLVSQDSLLPGMADPDPAARFLVQHMLSAAEDEPGLHVFVTHDTLVITTAARLLGVPLGSDAWPWYLEGAFFWRESGRICVAYQNLFHYCNQLPLCHLDERDVIGFTRREVARTIGTSCSARFFLVGGVFKTLLTNRPPRDLDIWAPTAQDRECLLETLMKRDAHRLDSHPFADTFEIGGRIVKLPYEIGPGTLEAHLARSDIALSAVGVEHRADDMWSAFVHPRARLSAQQREILLLKPLVNWKYALVTLERARRYTEELGYRVPPEVDVEVWRVFESRPRDVQLSMLERFERVTLGGYSVREEAIRRLR